MTEQQTETVKASAEGATLPTGVITVPAAMPTAEEVWAEFHTYKAAADIYVGAKKAFRKGMAIPASHPMLQDQEGRAGWLSRGYAVPYDQG